MTKQTPQVWVVREGVEPLAHIGPGPLTEEQFAAAEDAYLAAHYGGAEHVPADAVRPRDTGGYVRIAAPDHEDEPAAAGDGAATDAAEQE